MLSNRPITKTYVLPICLCLLVTASCGTNSKGDSRISREAAASCELKVKQLEAISSQTSAKNIRTRFTDEEINSYLALVLQPTFHPSLRNISFDIDRSGLTAVAIIDFDRLVLSQQGVLTRFLAKILSGVHTLTLEGTLISGEGKARFQLSEAMFDSRMLPKVVVEEIISLVGSKQNPPFDPMEPSEMPFGIKDVELNTGHIIVIQ
jgi:hypothetical protein